MGMNGWMSPREPTASKTIARDGTGGASPVTDGEARTAVGVAAADGVPAEVGAGGGASPFLFEPGRPRTAAARHRRWNRRLRRKAETRVAQNPRRLGWSSAPSFTSTS